MYGLGKNITGTAEWQKTLFMPGMWGIRHFTRYFNYNDATNFLKARASEGLNPFADLRKL